MLNQKYFLDYVPVQGNVFARDIGAAEERYVIPPHWFNSIVEFTVKGDAVFLLFGDSGVLINAADFSGLAAEVLTDDEHTGLYIPAETTARLYVPSTEFSFLQGGASASRHTLTHFAVEGLGAASQWYAQAVTALHRQHRT